MKLFHCHCIIFIDYRNNAIAEKLLKSVAGVIKLMYICQIVQCEHDLSTCLQNEIVSLFLSINSNQLPKSNQGLIWSKMQKRCNDMREECFKEKGQFKYRFELRMWQESKQLVS